MSRTRRGIAQARNVALDLTYAGRPLRDLRKVTSDQFEVSAPHGCDYQLIRRVFAEHPITTGDVFADIGCGYGRVCVAVARQDLAAQVIGIEGEHDSASKARLVQQRYPQISIVEGWAPQSIPPAISYAFMYNPFPGDVAIQVLERLHTTGATHLRVVMLNQRDEVAIRSSAAAQAYDCTAVQLQGTGLLKGIDIPLLAFERVRMTADSGA